jgi:Zn-dependent protease
VFTHRIPLFKLLGFQVWIDWSWFILAVLITWSLAAGLFPALFKEANLSTATLWSMGVAGAIGLFVSIVLHELGHSLVARRFGMQMRGITLFVFGGVAEMTDEPPSAGAEFFMAIGGPIVSVVIGVCMLAPTMVGATLHWPIEVVGVTGWLGWINLVLVGFNLIPAFPLDGGRVLRAALWQWKKDLRWATHVTARLGSAFGIFLIAFGVLSAVFGNLIGGIWWFVLGMFLRGAARMSYQQVLFRRALEGEPVERFMRRDPVTVQPDMSVQELVEHFVYRHQFKLYPVTENGHLLGCVTLSAIKHLPQEEWGSRRVGDIMADCTEDNTVAPSSDAMHALAKLNRTGASRLMVADDGHLAGVLALKDVVGFLSMKVDLEHH